MKTKKKSNQLVYIAIIFFSIIVTVFVVWKMFFIKEEIKFNKTEEVFHNPLMGFAVNADYPEAVEDNTLVYVDITWKEWEPIEGEFAWEQIWEENNLSRWKQEGKRVVLRFVCDVPGEESHMDIPEWLYEKTKDGIFYDTSYGKGYAPEYTNTYFIEKHHDTLVALGEYFKEEQILCYVQLGSLGHWGEWHMNYAQGTTRMPSQAVRSQYVSAYEEAFPYAKLLARRPFVETVENGFGVYNDMTGHVDSTKEWLSWIESGGAYNQPLISEQLIPCLDIWNTAPIGGEFTSSLSYEDMLSDNLNETLSLIKDSHMTFIGPKCPILDEVDEYNNAVKDIKKTIGYRYGIRSAVFSYWKWSKEATLTLTIENNGVAPIYFPWKMYLYIYDASTSTTEKIEVPVSLMELYGGQTVSVDMKNIKIGDNISYGICIEDPDTKLPAIYLDMDVEQKELIYLFSR